MPSSIFSSLGGTATKTIARTTGAHYAILRTPHIPGNTHYFEGQKPFRAVSLSSILLFSYPPFQNRSKLTSKNVGDTPNIKLQSVMRQLGRVGGLFTIMWRSQTKQYRASYTQSQPQLIRRKICQKAAFYSILN